MTSSSSAFDYATPYDIMTGLWVVIASMYTPEGEYLHSVPSRVGVRWKTRHSLMHFRQDEESRKQTLLKHHPHGEALTKLVTLDYDLHIERKRSHAKSDTVTLNGAETRPDVYHFHLQLTSGGDWYNSHHCTSPNERHVMGPFVKDGKIAVVVAQTLTRLSYDVPKEFIRDL